MLQSILIDPPLNFHLAGRHMRIPLRMSFELTHKMMNSDVQNLSQISIINDPKSSRRLWYYLTRNPSKNGKLHMNPTPSPYPKKCSKKMTLGWNVLMETGQKMSEQKKIEKKYRTENIVSLKIYISHSLLRLWFMPELSPQRVCVQNSSEARRER